MFESPAKVAVSPNSKTMSAAEQEALSKGEGRKLVVMFVLFVICGAFAVQLLLPAPARPDNAPRGIPLSEEEMVQMDKRFIAEVKIQPFVENEDVENTAQDFNQDQFEDDIFHYYIHKVHQSTDEELKAQYSGKNIPYIDFNRLDKIQLNRGKVQRLHGRILSYWQRVLTRWPNNSGLAWIWQAMVQTDEGIFMVAITDKDFEPEVGRLHGDSIEIDAVFIKGYQYSSKKGVLRMPLMAGRDFKRIRSATYDESYPLPLAYAMTFITLLMIFGGFVVHQYYKRADKSMGLHRATLRRKRMERNNKVDSTKTAKDTNEEVTAAEDVAPAAATTDSPKAETTDQTPKSEEVSSADKDIEASKKPENTESAEPASTNPETADPSETASTKDSAEPNPDAESTSTDAPDNAAQKTGEEAKTENTESEAVPETRDEKVETPKEDAKPDSSSPDA